MVLRPRAGSGRSTLRTMFAAGVLISWLCTSISAQNREKEDVYEFGPPFEYKHRYKRDGKLITNNDFYCTACAKEKRIAQKKRDDMAEVLEVTKHYKPPLNDGTKERHFGKFRMMEQDGEAVLSFLFKDIKAKDPVFIEDGNFRIFCDLPSFNTKKVKYRRRLEEHHQLNDVFPKVTDKTIVLKPHHRAHQLLIRSQRLHRDFLNLVEFNPKKAPFTYLGPWMGLDQKFEIYVFAKKKSYFLFNERFLGKVSKDNDGLAWHNLKDKSMVVAIHAEGLSDPDINNALSHRFAYALVTGYAQYRYDLPAWLALGYAHLMERRERTDFNTLIFGEGKSPNFKFPKVWRAYVLKRMLAGKIPSFSSFAEKERINTLLPDQHPYAWSLASYLMMKDQKAFGKFIRDLKTKKDGESMRKLVIRALKSSYGMSILQVDAGWRDWVKENYSAN